MRKLLFILCCLISLQCSKVDYESAGVRVEDGSPCAGANGWWKYVGPRGDVMAQYDPTNYVPVECMQDIKCTLGTLYPCAIQAPAHLPEGNIPDMQAITSRRNTDQP